MSSEPSKEPILANEPIIVIDQQTRSVRDVQQDIASLQTSLTETDEAFTAMVSQRTGAHLRINQLSDALMAAGFPVTPT